MRIAKTLDLGSYVWYGAIVLAIEIAGATTTLVWCLNIVMDPVHEPLKMDPDNPGLTLVSVIALSALEVLLSTEQSLCQAAEFDVLLVAKGCCI